jgi:hypothetical protein
LEVEINSGFRVEGRKREERRELECIRDEGSAEPE